MTSIGQEVALNMGWDGSGQGAGGHSSWVNNLTDEQRTEYGQTMAAETNPNNINQAVALQMGWTGKGQGNGGHINWVNSLDDASRSQYNQVLSSVQNPETMPLLAEPLHEWEKAGLTASANGMDYSGINGASNQLSQMLSKTTNAINGEVMDGSAMIDRGVESITPDEVFAMQNPYADHLKSSLSTEGEKIRAQATSTEGLRGGRSFGDTATGVRQSEIDESLMRGYGDIDYKTFETALGQINTERNRFLSGADGKFSGANALTSGASVVLPGYEQQVDNQKYLAENRMKDAVRTMESGKYVRDYNQGVNNLISSDNQAEQGHEYQQLVNVMNLLQNFDTNTSSSQSGGSNGTQQAGGLLQALSGVGQTFFNNNGGGGSTSSYSTSSNDFGANISFA